MPPQLQDITADIDEILEIDVADIDSILAQPDTIDTSIPGIEDDIISKTKTDDILQRIEERKTPDFLDKFFRSFRGFIVDQRNTGSFIHNPIFQPLSNLVNEPTAVTAKSDLERYLATGDIEKVKQVLDRQGELDKIKNTYSMQQDRGFFGELGTSFTENILPDYIDNTGDEQRIQLQEEVNAILQSEGLEPIDFNNELTFTQNIGKAVGNTAALLPYYYIGGALTAPTRAAALGRIVQIANPRSRAALNVIQNVAHTAAAFSAAEVLHSGYDPKNVMINGVLQGSGEAIAEMALYPVLAKTIGKEGAKYAARWLATSTTEFFQELTGQYFSTGELPDVETIGITAIVSGLFGIAARKGMEVDILNVYNNAVKERERLLNKRKNDPDNFTEKDLKTLNESNNLAEAIKNNAANWKLKNQFKQFVEDRKKKRGDSFQKAKQRLESLSKVAGALSTEVDVKGLSDSPENLISYLESRGFTEQEIVNTPPEDILADPRIITEVEQQDLIDNYYEIFQGLGDLQEEFTNPEQLLTYEELFGDGSQRELGITKTEVPTPEITKKEILPTKEEIPEITEAELPKVEVKKEEIEPIKPEPKAKVEEPKVEPTKEPTSKKEPTKKLGQEIVDSPDRDKTTLAVKWGLTLTDKQAEEVRAEIKRGTDQFREDIEAGKEVDPNEPIRLQSLREALSAKTGKSIEYTTEEGFTEVPLEKNKILSDVVKKVKGEEGNLAVDEAKRAVRETPPPREIQEKRINLIEELGYADVAHAINSVNKRRRERGLGGVYENIQEIPEEELRNAAETSESVAERKATQKAQMTEAKKPEPKVGEKAEPKKAKLPSGEVVEIIEQPTLEDIGLTQPTRSDIDETISTSDLPTQSLSPVDIPQSDLTQSEVTSKDLPTANVRDVETNTDNSSADNTKETDGRDEYNVEENTADPSQNGLIVTRIVNQEDVKDSFTLSGWLAARGIAIMPADIELAAINSNQDFPTFVKALVRIIGKDKFKSLNSKESTFRRVWFKSKDKITKNNFIAEDGKGITLNTSRSPGEDFINRIDNASQMDLMVNDYNNQNPNDKISLYYFDGYYIKDKSKRTGKDYYTTLGNAVKSVKEKQKEFLKSRFIFYSTASDGKKEVWIQASQNIWGRFSNKEDATKFYNDRKSKYKLPDLKETDNVQFLATRLYYFEKMDGVLKTGLTDANFTKRAQIYMSAGGHLNGQQFKAEFLEETDFYDFNPNTHEITRSNKGEKEAHDGAVYLTLDKMKEVMGYMGEGGKRIFKPFFYTVDKNGRPIGLKCAVFVAPPEMEAEMKKAGVDTRVYLSAEKMGQVKGGEKIVLDGKNMVVNATEVEEHSEATFTRAIFPTLPVDHGNLRPTDTFNKFVKKRISQFTNLVQRLLGNADTANQFLRKQVKYTGNSKYENVGRMLEMGFSWHPEVIKVVKDIFKNKYINDNLMKFKRKGSTSYLAPDHNGNVKVGEVLLPEYFLTKLGVKVGDKVVVNRSPSARVDNFRVLTVKGFHSKSRHGNAITMNGGETIFYQESDYDIDKVHIVTDMTKEEIAVLESLQKAVGVVPVEKSKKVDNIWDVNQQWAVQDRFSAGKLAIGEITNIQTVYSMLVQNRKALQVSPKGEVVVVDLNYAIQNGNKDNFYLIPKFQDEIEMQKFMAPIHQASVDNAKLDALSTIMDGQPYTRDGLIHSLFSVVEPNFKIKSKLGDKFDPIQIGFNNSSSPMRQMLNVMKTFTKDWDDGGSKWSYDDQHNAIMTYKNNAQNRTDEAGETLFPNSPLHNFFIGYPRASLTNGGYWDTPMKKAVYQFRDVLRMHHYEAMEAAFRKDIDRLDPYKGGKISPERNDQMTNTIIEIFKLKDQYYRGEIPTTDSVEVTPNGTLNHLEGYHTKVKRLIDNLKLNPDEKLWFDLKMLNNFDGIQSKGSFKGNLSPEQLKEVLLRDYNTRREFLTKQEGKEYKQMSPDVFFYPKSREDAFKSRYEPYFISIAISDETLKKYANAYNNFYNINIRKKQEISSGFLAESKGSLGIGIDPSRIMDTFGGALKAANKYLNPKGEASWWKWFAEDKHAEITNRQIAKINEKLDKVYGTEVWGEKTVTDFIVHTLTEGTGSRPATRARLDFDQVPITIEEGNMLILELESIYRQLNTSKPGKFKQSAFLTKELMYKHPITKRFYDTLNSKFKDVSKYASRLFLDIESLEKGTFKVEEPVTIPLLSVKSPFSMKVTRKRINGYHKLYKKYMELKIKQDMGETVSESQIESAQKAYESYLERNPDVKDTLDLMRGVATIHQEINEAAIIGSTILRTNPAIKSELVKEGIIPSNYKSEKLYWNKVLDYFDKKGIKYSTNIYDPAYDVAKRAEIRRRKAEYEDRWQVKIKMPDEQLFIAIDRMDKAAKEIYDFDKETFDTYIKPRKEELKQQIIINLTGLKTKSGKEIDVGIAEKIADKLLSFIPDNFRRIDRYFPWINFDFQVERQYSVWNLDSLTDDIKSGALSLDEWLGKPTTTGFFKPRRADWQTALKEGNANIPWDIPEVLRVRMLASMNVRKISAVRAEFANLFKEVRTNILDGKLTPREETFFTGIERYLNILKYDLQSIPWARKALKYGTFNGDYSNNDYLDATEIKEWQRTFYTNADMWSKIYRNMRTFAFLGLEMPVSIRNVTSQGIVVAGADLGYKRIMKSVGSLTRPGAIKSGSAIVPEKVNGEWVTNDRLMVDLGLAEDDILANIQESNLPTQFSIMKDIDKSQFAKLTEKAYKLSGQMANWSLENINVGPGFAKSFFGIPLSFRDSEIYLNRLGTAKAAVQKVWEDFDKRGVSITPEEKYKKALEYARKKVDEIHFDYGLLNRPQMMRHKMGASVFIFRSFTWNQANMFYNWAREWKQVSNWENSKRMIYFGSLQALGVMAKAFIGIEFVRFVDWALGDLAKDFWNYMMWLLYDDEKALNEIGFGGTKKIRDVFPDIDENTAAAIAATNHIFTGIVPDMIQMWLFINSDEELREPWNLSKRNKNLLALYQAGGLKQPIKITKFNENLSKTIRAMRKGIDPKYPDETMKPADFIQWYFTRQMLGTYIPYPEYNTKLEPPSGVGIPDTDIKSITPQRR